MCPPEVEVHPHVLHGRVYDEIITAANRLGVDAIVMGSHTARAFGLPSRAERRAGRAAREAIRLRRPGRLRCPTTSSPAAPADCPSPSGRRHLDRGRRRPPLPRRIGRRGRLVPGPFRSGRARGDPRPARPDRLRPYRLLHVGTGRGAGRPPDRRGAPRASTGSTSSRAGPRRWRPRSSSRGSISSRSESPGATA
jgi:hypothetical protein